MELLAFPCNGELIGFFLDRLEPAPRAALMLEKQEPFLRPLLVDRGITELFILPEVYYGNLSSARSREVLAEIRRRNFSRALFPISDFCGNAALLLASLVPSVAAVSATSPTSVVQDLSDPPHRLSSACGIDRSRLTRLQQRIVERLQTEMATLQGMAAGGRAGEKPASGLLANFPYDCEVLFRYAFAASKLHGKVLEVGCGIGYGAYLMVELNPSLQVRAVDNDPEAIALAKRLWGDHTRLQFTLADAGTLPCSAGEMEGAVAFEVIEHLKQPQDLLVEVRRVLQLGGSLIGSTPNSLLFPYRVNDRWEEPPESLRKQGIWPWHLQPFDEASLVDLAGRCGFAQLDIHYPTFAKGMALHEQLGKVSFGQALDLLSRLNWSAADFAAFEEYVPCFSGYSFIFSGVSGR